MRENYSDLITAKQWPALVATIPSANLGSVTMLDHVKIPMDKSVMTVNPSTISGVIPIAQRRRLQLKMTLSVVVLPVMGKEMETGNSYTLLTQMPLLPLMTPSITSVNTVFINKLVIKGSSITRMSPRNILSKGVRSLKMSRPWPQKHLLWHLLRHLLSLA